MTVFSAFLQPFFPCLIAVLCQEILIMCDKVDKPRKPAFIMAASSYLKGSFNNYEDLILPNFDHLPSSSGQLQTTYILSTLVCQREHSITAQHKIQILMRFYFLPKNLRDHQHTYPRWTNVDSLLTTYPLLPVHIVFECPFTL